jgi:hypothetical protein
MQFWFVAVVPKYLNFATACVWYSVFRKDLIYYKCSGVVVVVIAAISSSDESNVTRKRQVAEIPIES